MATPQFSKAALAQAQFLAAWLNSTASMQWAQANGMEPRRLDANETNMLALSLEQMRTRVYEADYPELKARTLFPIATDIDPGADTFAYEENDHVGKFKRISGLGRVKDLPTVEASATKVVRTLESYGGSFGYTIQDLRRASFSGRSLDVRKANACRRAWEEALDVVAAVGDPGSSITSGIANRALGTGASQTRNTAFGTAAWTPATVNADTMFADLMKIVKEFVVDSKETQHPTDLALPLAHYMLAAHTYFGDATTDTVLTRFLRDNGFVKRVHSWEALKAANHGVEATDRALLYKNDSDAGEIVIAQDFEVFPPQVDGFATMIMAHGRTAGFCVYRPLAFRYGTALPA